MMQGFETGTLAGAGSFHCESCGYAVALHEGDELPACPACGGQDFRRSSLFATVAAPAPFTARVEPPWLAEVREAAHAMPGEHLAFECDDRPRVMALKEGWTRVGRSMSADVRLDDPTVSRRHALLYTDEDGAKVLDDRSLNGVYLNGQRVELAELHDGDTISVGRFNLHFLA